ncbi:MAG TPA: hypothetical protein VL381_07760 [Rhodocyclaceae bacterium]|nr:hypothetical protein [Rhodocyclaceae bacterium]
MAQENALHQINISYDQVQDRLLLRMTNTGGQEFQYWLTRRFVGMLWQALGHVFDWFGKQQVGSDSLLNSVRKELVAQHATDGAKLDDEYQGGTQLVSGMAPLLLTTINIRPLPPSLYLLQLEPLDGQSIDLRMDEKLAHVISHMLKEATRSAEWALPGAEATQTLGEINPSAGYRLH